MEFKRIQPFHTNIHKNHIYEQDKIYNQDVCYAYPPFQNIKEKQQRINKKILEAKQIFSDKFDHIIRQLQIFNQLIEEDQVHKEEITNQREHEIQYINELADKYFKSEREGRENQETQLTNKIDQVFAKYKNQILEEKQAREEDNGELNEIVKNDLPQLNLSLQLLKENRIENLKNIETSFKDQNNKQQQFLQNESQLRQSSEDAVYQLLKQIISESKTAIEKEKKERQMSEETMLQLLEKTCGQFPDQNNIICELHSKNSKSQLGQVDQEAFMVQDFQQLNRSQSAQGNIKFDKLIHNQDSIQEISFVENHQSPKNSSSIN